MNKNLTNNQGLSRPAESYITEGVWGVESSSFPLQSYTTMPAHRSSNGTHCPARTSTGNLPEGVEFNIHNHSLTRNSGQLSWTGIFHVLFALFFLTLTILICSDLILSISSHSFQTISPTHSVCRKQENTKHELYSMRVKPPARSLKMTLPPGSENPPYHSSRSWPRRSPHHQPCG